MSTLLNSVKLIGRVGADADIKSFESGSKKARVNLATNSRQKNVKGEYEEITHWHTLIFWNKQAELIEKFVKKGDKLAIEGELTYNEYVTKEGVKKQYTEIRVREMEFLSPKKSNSEVLVSANDDSDGLPF